MKELEIALVARIGGQPVILARMLDDALVREALRRAIDAAVHQASQGCALNLAPCPSTVM